MGVSSALVQNNRHDAPMQNINNNNAPMAAANQDGANNNIQAVANLNVGNNNASRAVANHDEDNSNLQAVSNQNDGNNNVTVAAANHQESAQEEFSDEDVYMDENSDDSYLQKKGTCSNSENSASSHIEEGVGGEESLPSTSGTPLSRIGPASTELKVTCTCACHHQATETLKGNQDSQPNSMPVDATTSQEVQDSSLSQKDHCSEPTGDGRSVVAKARNECSDTERHRSNEVKAEEPMDASESSRLDIVDIPVKVLPSPVPRRPSTIERKRNPSGPSSIIPSPGAMNIHSPTDDYDVYIGFSSAKNMDSTGSIASMQAVVPIDRKNPNQPVASSSNSDSTLCRHNQTCKSVVADSRDVLPLEKQDAKLRQGTTSEVNENEVSISDRKGKSIRGKRKGIVKKCAIISKATVDEVLKVDQACQAISEEIREATKKAKENEDAELSHGTDLAMSSVPASSSTGKRSLSLAGRGEATSSGHFRSRKTMKRPMNVCHKSTSTSDPVIEDDHTQVRCIRVD